MQRFRRRRLRRDGRSRGLVHACHAVYVVKKRPRIHPSHRDVHAGTLQARRDAVLGVRVETQLASAHQGLNSALQALGNNTCQMNGCLHCVCLRAMSAMGEPRFLVSASLRAALLCVTWTRADVQVEFDGVAMRCCKASAISQHTKPAEDKVKTPSRPVSRQNKDKLKTVPRQT